jgi:hypothetical protein
VTPVEQIAKKEAREALTTVAGEFQDEFLRGRFVVFARQAALEHLDALGEIKDVRAYFLSARRFFKGHLGGNLGS